MGRKSKRTPAFLADPPKPSMFGGFTMPPVISTDPDESRTDPYINLEPIPSRYLGKNMTTTAHHSGHGPDAYLGKKFLSLASSEQNGDKSDPYRTMEEIDRERRNAAKKKNIGDDDFKYVSFPKKSTGPGSFFGTLSNKPFEHMQDYKVPTKDDVPPQPVHEPSNFKVNPPKKGTFGYPGTTFGPRFEHKADGYEETRAREKAAWEAEQKKRLGGVWKISLKSNTTFDENGLGVSKVFDNYDAPEEKPRGRRRRKKDKVWPGKPLVHPAVFKFTNPPKKGQQGYMGKFPNAREDGMEDPYQAGPRDPNEGKKKKKRGKKEPKPLVHDSHWKPATGEKTSVVRSLLRRFY